MIQHIRLNALMAAMWINYLLLIVVSLSIYNINYLTVMACGMATPLVIFLLVYHFNLYRLNRNLHHEKITSVSNEPSSASPNSNWPNRSASAAKRSMPSKAASSSPRPCSHSRSHVPSGNRSKRSSNSKRKIRTGATSTIKGSLDRGCPLYYGILFV